MQPLSRAVIRNVLRRIIESDKLACRSSRPQTSEDVTDTDLAFFHPDEPLPLVPQDEFTRVRRLASGVGRDVYQYRWAKRDVPAEIVAVKDTRAAMVRGLRRREVNDRKAHLTDFSGKPIDPEDVLAEIGALRYLSRQADVSKHIIALRGAFTTAAGDIWLVTEYAAGGDLFDLVKSQSLGEMQVCKYLWQLLHGLECMHRHRIAHRDVSLENVLLKDGSVRLMDLGLVCRTHDGNGVPFRYFRAVGKEQYCSPEVYVPKASNVSLLASADVSPGAVSLATGGLVYEVRWPLTVKPGQVCQAEVAGYAAAPVDIFAAAICLFAMAWGCPPWRAPTLSDPLFTFAYDAGDRGLERLLQSWHKPPLSPTVMQLLHDMAQWDPASRPTAEQCRWVLGSHLDGRCERLDEKPLE